MNYKKGKREGERKGGRNIHVFHPLFVQWTASHCTLQNRRIGASAQAELAKFSPALARGVYSELNEGSSAHQASGGLLPAVRGTTPKIFEPPDGGST